MSAFDKKPAPALPHFADVRDVGDTRVIVNFDADLFCGAPAASADVIVDVLASGSFEGIAAHFPGLYEAAPDDVKEDLQRLMVELLTAS